MANTELSNPLIYGRDGASLIRTSEFAFDDPAAIVATDAGWDYEVYQLSAGPLGYRLRRLEIGGLVLEWVCLKASVAVHEIKQVSDLAIAIPLELSSDSLFGGQRFGFGEISVFGPASDFCHRTEPGVYTLFITVERALADGLGWPEDPPTTTKTHVPKDWLRNILCRIDTAARLIDMCGDTSGVDAPEPAVHSLILALDELMTQVENANQSNGMSTNAQKNMSLVAAVHGRLLSEDWWDQAAIALAADELCVSERTLYRAINSSIGMAPRAYQKRLRLHLVRQALTNASPDLTSVTDIAMDHGFWHLGRFSQDFRAVFGDRPSDALENEGSSS